MRNKFARVSNPNEFISSSGELFHLTYESRLHSDGTIKLSVSGRKDIKKEINSYAAECDMAVIISKLQFGDTSVLNHKPPLYGDFTKFPKTYAEMIDLVGRSELAFQSLDNDVKALFDNDRNKWFASIGTPLWLEAMGFEVERPSERTSEVGEKE